MKALRIGTRKSQLALWQAEHVRSHLRALAPALAIELVPMSTEGDRLLDRRLAQAGGKGLFTKELEHGLAERHIDIAVHSLKDVTVALPEGLTIGAICERADPRDAFVSRRYANLAALPPGARVGTASLRRQCQLRAAYPRLQIAVLRGNVNTRLAKLDGGEFDAVVLACAGLTRLGLQGHIRDVLDPEQCLPAVGQGAIGIECRADDHDTLELLGGVDHAASRICVTAERAMNRRLEGGCQVPIGGYAELRDTTLHLRGLVGAPDGSHVIRAEIRGPGAEAERLGSELGAELLARGAGAILDRVYGRA